MTPKEASLALSRVIGKRIASTSLRENGGAFDPVLVFEDGSTLSFDVVPAGPGSQYQYSILPRYTSPPR